MSRLLNNQPRRISIYRLQRRPSFGFESSVSSTPMTSGDPMSETDENRALHSHKTVERLRRVTQAYSRQREGSLTSVFRSLHNQITLLRQLLPLPSAATTVRTSLEYSVYSELTVLRTIKKVKAYHTRHRALGPELIPVYRQSACR